MIYFDNAAGSYPKPERVRQAVMSAFERYGANPGRGAYALSRDTSRHLSQARAELAGFFGCPLEERMVFTSGATESLNMAIKGFLKKGDHVAYSGMEHNAARRPIAQLEKQGIITATKVAADREGMVLPQDFAAAINPQTRLLVCLQASNVNGAVMPIEKIAQIAKKHKIAFLVDASQSAGLIPIDAGKTGIDLLCLAGHKALYGPAGIGALYVGEGIALEPLVVGGTGSNSTDPLVPSFYPDHLESGTPNMPGISGLLAAVDFIRERGVDYFFEQSKLLAERFVEGAANIEGLRLFLPPADAKKLAVISLQIAGGNIAEAAYILDNDYQIAVRAGLHCSPLAHQSLGTIKEGTLRFSFSCFNTKAEIDKGLLALNTIARTWQKRNSKIKIKYC